MILSAQIEPFPSRVVLELTPQCNLSCSMCPRHHIKQAEGFMANGLFKKLIDETKSENPRAVILPFWRGESCLHPHFVELLDYALNRGMRIHLSTNGHFMDRSFMEIFYRCEFVTFSLHTYTGYKNAKKMAAEKPSWSHCTMQVSFVNTEKNTADFLAECTSHETLQGFDSIRLYIEHTVGGEFGRSATAYDAKRTFCPKLNNTFVVSADGEYSRCNHIWQPEVDTDLARSSIKETWDGSRLNEIRHAYPDGRCGLCDQWSGHTTGEAWRKNEQGSIEHFVYGAGNDN
jgi:organic radical activating enzyme